MTPFILKIHESIDYRSYLLHLLLQTFNSIHSLFTCSEESSQDRNYWQDGNSQRRRLCESADVKVLNLVHPQALTISWEVLQISESSNSDKNIKAYIILILVWNICQLQSFPPLLRQNIQGIMTTHMWVITKAQAALAVHLQKCRKYSIITSSFRQSTGRLKISWPLQKM